MLAESRALRLTSNNDPKRFSCAKSPSLAWRGRALRVRFLPVATALPEKDVAAKANELSGETARRNLEGLARFTASAGSQGFHAAAELVAERGTGLWIEQRRDPHISRDGKIFYGTRGRVWPGMQKSRNCRGQGRRGNEDRKFRPPSPSCLRRTASPPTSRQI